jgi:hypothetical protein
MSRPPFFTTTCTHFFASPTRFALIGTGGARNSADELADVIVNLYLSILTLQGFAFRLIGWGVLWFSHWGVSLILAIYSANN